jgi:hypothetical protein
MGSRQKQVAVATKGAKHPSAASSKGPGKGKGKAVDPPEQPVSPARGRRAGASQVSSDAVQDARDEAQAMVTADDDDKTPPPSPPQRDRSGGGLTERQKKQAEEQKRVNEAKVIANLNTRLAAATAQLKLALEKDKKRKESSSGESANPGRQKKMSNASTRRKQVPIFRFNYFSGCHFIDGLSVHRQSLILLTLIMLIL